MLAATFATPGQHARRTIVGIVVALLVLALAPVQYAAAGPWDLAEVTTTPISVGQMQNGSLSISSPRSENGRHAQFWRFSLSSNRCIQIELNSSSFDTVLVLRRNTPHGSQVAFNDDGGIGLNARIAQTLSPGNYVIQATSFSANGAGPYSLGVDNC